MENEPTIYNEKTSVLRKRSENPAKEFKLYASCPFYLEVSIESGFNIRMSYLLGNDVNKKFEWQLKAKKKQIILVNYPGAVLELRQVWQCCNTSLS